MPKRCLKEVIRDRVQCELKTQIAGTLLPQAHPPHAREVPNQRTWIDYGLPDLRPLDAALRSTPPDEVPAASSMDDAVEVLARAFGMGDPMVDRIAMTTPVGLVTVHREKLVHIVEKRSDARERYVNYAIDTLRDPFEVWSVEYDNGNHRRAFIGAFQGKRQMLVIVEMVAGELLWNFMHSDAKSLNKHRHGMLLHKRYPWGE